MSSKTDESNKPSLSTTAFETLERDFQEVLSELAHDQHLEKFRIEYEKLHRTLLKSHENEKRLMRKCAELNAEIVANAGKVHTALKLSQDDQNTIYQLKKELEKAWKMVEASHEKESKAKETIEALTKEIGVLSKLVDHGHGISADQEDTVNELLRQKETFEKERDTSLRQIQQLMQDAALYQDEIKQYAQQQQAHREELATLKDQLVRSKMETEHEERARFKAEKTLMETRNLLEKKLRSLSEKDQLISEYELRFQDLDSKLKEQSNESTLVTKHYEEAKRKIEEIETKLSKQIEETVEMENQKQSILADLKESEAQKFSLKSHLEKEQREKQQLQILTEKLKQRIEGEKDAKKSLQQRIQEYKEEILEQKRQWDRDVQQIDHVKHEKNLLERKATVTAQEVVRQKEKVKHVEDHKVMLEMNVGTYRGELEKTRTKIFALERENASNSKTINDISQKYQESQEELKMNALHAREQEKQVTDLQEKLKQQQALYEAVRSDRNMYSKSLIDSNEKIAEFKRKFGIMNNQMAQLNEEITVSDKTLCKVQMEMKQLQDEKRKLTSQIQKLKRTNADFKDTQTQQAQELSRLNQIIEAADAEREQHKKELERIINYRDILGTQLIRRNDEIALLYEKIKIQQSSLSKGAVQYRAKQEDVRMLKLKIQELQRKLAVMHKSLRMVPELKSHLAESQKRLLTQRTKVKALSEELENPMNVHRWRKLEGSDPTAYEMILKIQTLQKRLIKKNEEVMEKDLIIQEKQKLYEELKKILQHQPGPEVAEQLNIYQDSLKKKNVQMKTMASELNMYMFKVKETRYEADRLARELSETKKRYYNLKKQGSTSARTLNSSQSGRRPGGATEAKQMRAGFGVRPATT
eukprot:CAMPEP_0117448192 /NCGR_PEP_ID=MMETSP0759-20121206/7272_1 /TAXON_ID=63605 /ORGANISM="Percolomonas cosmopolitus, Strain WS" /LENGTH=871 /DNA_ID=CAMNT_0005240567 /DNA_START=253 /DNA_END=2865 /DNA_ORIENTATION=+